MAGRCRAFKISSRRAGKWPKLDSVGRRVEADADGSRPSGQQQLVKRERDGESFLRRCRARLLALGRRTRRRR